MPYPLSVRKHVSNNPDMDHHECDHCGVPLGSYGDDETAGGFYYGLHEEDGTFEGRCFCSFFCADKARRRAGVEL